MRRYRLTDWLLDHPAAFACLCYALALLAGLLGPSGARKALAELAP